jgi:hypothetical protein
MGRFTDQVKARIDLLFPLDYDTVNSRPAVLDCAIKPRSKHAEELLRQIEHSNVVLQM